MSCVLVLAIDEAKVIANDPAQSAGKPASERVAPVDPADTLPRAVYATGSNPSFDDADND